MKQVQFTSGCPNQCSYCYEPKEMKYYSPVIPNDEEIEILDMNFLANPDHLKILRGLPKRRYNLVCGVDFRRLTPEIVNLLKKKGFYKIRWAWDYNFGSQRVHHKTYKMLRKGGFSKHQLMVFVLVNWKIPFYYCLKKLDTLKIWNVEVSDCCFDGGYKVALSMKCKLFWSIEEIYRFRKISRLHNQLIRMNGFDVEAETR